MKFEEEQKVVWEASLRAESEESCYRGLLAAIASATPDAIFAKDRQGRFFFCNQAAADLFGYPISELRGKHATDFLLPEAARAVEAIDRQVMESGERLVIEETRARRDGRPDRTLLTTKVPYRDPVTGEVAGIVVVSRDITEQKRIEAERQDTFTALQRSESRFQAFMQYTPAIVFIKDDQSRLVYCNGEFERHFGVTLENERNRTDYDRLPAEVARETVANDRRVLETNEPQETIVCVPTVDGIRRRWLTFKFPIVEPDGTRLIGSVAFDVTERQELQERLHQAEKLAAVGSLVAGVMHEINNPLAAISGHAQLLALNPAEDVQQDARTIRTMADRASRIVRSLLAFSRRHEPKREARTVEQLIQDTLDLCEYQLRASDIALVTDIAPDLPSVQVDSNQIQQVLLNLITNAEQALRGIGVEPGARSATPPVVVERRLCISAAFAPAALSEASTGGVVCITVQDNGPGIAPDQLSRVFDPFFTTKDVGEGSGLGLSICHGIVSEHGGNLTVESSPEKGTIFSLFLPVYSPAPMN